MSTTLLGSKIDFPVCVAPTGAQCYIHWEGETAMARGIDAIINMHMSVHVDVCYDSTTSDIIIIWYM